MPNNLHQQKFICTPKKKKEEKNRELKKRKDHNKISQKQMYRLVSFLWDLQIQPINVRPIESGSSCKQGQPNHGRSLCWKAMQFARKVRGFVIDADVATCDRLLRLLYVLILNEKRPMPVVGK